MSNSDRVILRDFYNQSARIVFSANGKRYTFYFEDINKPTNERVSIWVRPEGTSSKKDLLNVGNTLGLYHNRPNFGKNGLNTEEYYIAGGPFGMLTSDLHLSCKYREIYQVAIQDALKHFNIENEWYSLHKKDLLGLLINIVAVNLVNELLIDDFNNDGEFNFNAFQNKKDLTKQFEKPDFNPSKGSSFNF